MQVMDSHTLIPPLHFENEDSDYYGNDLYDTNSVDGAYDDYDEWNHSIITAAILPPEMKALRHDTDMSVENAILPLDTCPICEEARNDVVVLDHWEASGEISEHKMCAPCRASYTNSQCPFCREILCKEEFMNFIHCFVNSFVCNLSGMDRNIMAETFEQWQVLEMELEGNIRVINRIAKHILEDELFNSTVRCSVDSTREVFREISGVIFRFWALVHDSGLQLCRKEKELLEEAIEFVNAPLEGSNPVKLNGGKNYASLYMQVLVAFLSARNSGCNVKFFTELAQRVGYAIINS